MLDIVLTEMAVRQPFQEEQYCSRQEKKIWEKRNFRNLQHNKNKSK